MKVTYNDYYDLVVQYNVAKYNENGWKRKSVYYESLYASMKAQEKVGKKKFRL